MKSVFSYSSYQIFVSFFYLKLLIQNPIKELAHADPDMLKRELGVIGLQQFFHANGIDETRLTDKYKRKSVSFSNSQTLPRDYTRKSEIGEYLWT